MAGFVMFGTFRATPGRRDELLELMLAEQQPMPGCELYLVGPSGDDPDAICIVERWTDEAAHAASLTLPNVRATIERAMPLSADMSGTKFEPAGGIGL
ncbi:MAG: Antibiotic biosynthesis monooxygenase [Thermoleophilia bacterium]|nr:Antibiotic biosynthesis monooxygenase [Thermoleophilia bacterium]